MVRRCCVPTCRNSRACRKDAEERPRITFFKSPSEPNLYEHWARVIAEHSRGELGPSSVICERHFPEEDIRKQAVLRDSDGNVIFQKPLTKYYLMKNAVPSIFHEDFDLQTAARRKRKRKKVMPEETKLFDYSDENVIAFLNDGSFDVNYSDILMALNESENNVMPFAVMANNCGQPQQFIAFDDRAGKEHQQIYMNHTELNHDMPSSLHKVQIPIKITGQISDLDGGNVEPPKEITILIPEEEMMLLNQNNAPTSYVTSTDGSRPPLILANGNETNKNAATMRGTTHHLHQHHQQQHPQHQSTPQPLQQQQPPPPLQPCDNLQSSVHYPLPESEIQMNIRTFDFIFYNSHRIKLPNAMWGYHKNSIDKNIIIFSKARWLKSDVSIPPIYEKQVIFHESDNIKIYINSKFSPLEAMRRPRSVPEMELILRSVDEIRVCAGGPSIADDSEAVHCAQKDHAVRRWRHKLCPIVVTADSEDSCKFCLTVSQVQRYPKKKRPGFGAAAAARRKLLQQQQQQEASSLTDELDMDDEEDAVRIED